LSAHANSRGQEGSELVTVPVFEASMREIDSRFDTLETKMELVRADVKSEVKSSQLQNVLWLSGIILASNGAVIALLARATKLF
jgi:tetrahydromethanopterin S-methyltransferase subunit G